MRFGSLFSGIGTIDLGLEQAGLKCAWQVEIDKTCRSVLERHWPDTARFSDVCDVGADCLTPVDLIAFGSPCQDLSIAGRRAGMAGERSGLFYEAIRVIRDLRPRFALWENVPGAFNSNGGRDFAAVLDAFLDSGARDIGWRVLDAQWFGVAQTRRRVFLVADFGGRCADQILSLTDCVRRYSTPRRQKGRTTPALSAGGAGVGRTGNERTEADFMIARSIRSRNDSGPREDYDTLIPDCARRLRAQGQMAHREDADTLIAFNGAQITSKTNRSIVEPGKAVPTLVGTAYPMVARCQTAGEGNRQDGESVTLIPCGIGGLDLGFARSANPSHSGDKGDGGVNTTMVAHAERVGNSRLPDANVQPSEWGVCRLTPLECERLQGLPDEWTAAGADGKPISDTKRYAMIGNAAAVPVLKYIGHHFLQVA